MLSTEFPHVAKLAGTWTYSEYAGAMDGTTGTTGLPEHRPNTAMDAEGEAAVVRIVLWCAWLEQSLLDLCVQLINHDDSGIGHAVTANMSTSGMLQLARTLIRGSNSISEQNKADALTVLAGAKAVLEKRNGVLQSAMGGSLLEGKTAFWNGKGKTFKEDHPEAGRQMYVHLGLEELDEIGANIFKTMDQTLFTGPQ